MEITAYLITAATCIGRDGLLQTNSGWQMVDGSVGTCLMIKRPICPSKHAAIKARMMK